MNFLKHTKKMLSTIGAGILGLLLSTSQTLATPILDFNVAAPTSGSVSYAGGSAALIGSGISVDTVVGLDTISNNGVIINCLSCVLNFSTGDSTGVWTWGGIGYITLTGTVDLDNSGNLSASDATGILLNGTFGNASVSAFGNTFKIAGSSFSDRKNEVLTNFYGFLPNLNFDGNFNLSFSAVGTSGGMFKSTTVLSGDIVNTPVNTPVPEPKMFLLFGTALVGFCLFGRRKHNLS